MIELDITKYDGKNIKVVSVNDRIFIGMGKYITSVDNDDQGEMLLVRDEQGWITELYPSEIKSVETNE